MQNVDLIEEVRQDAHVNRDLEEMDLAVPRILVLAIRAVQALNATRMERATHVAVQMVPVVLLKNDAANLI